MGMRLRLLFVNCRHVRLFLPRRSNNPRRASSCDPARQSRREDIFEPEDYRLYKDWLAESCGRFGVACLSLLPDAQPPSI
jgi:hypothetical protein